MFACERRKHDGANKLEKEDDERALQLVVWQQRSTRALGGSMNLRHPKSARLARALSLSLGRCDKSAGSTCLLQTCDFNDDDDDYYDYYCYYYIVQQLLHH